MFMISTIHCLQAHFGLEYIMLRLYPFVYLLISAIFQNYKLLYLIYNTYLDDIITFFFCFPTHPLHTTPSTDCNHYIHTVDSRMSYCSSHPIFDNNDLSSHYIPIIYLLSEVGQ